MIKCSPVLKAKHIKERGWYNIQLQDPGMEGSSGKSGSRLRDRQFQCQSSGNWSETGGNNFLSASCKPASNLCFVARRRFIEEDPGIEKVNLAKGGLQIINISSTLLRSKYVFAPWQTKAKGQISRNKFNFSVTFWPSFAQQNIFKN